MRFSVLILAMMLIIGGVVGQAWAFQQFATIGEFTEATGTAIDQFTEPPALQSLVETGELPPVEERLPAEPAVMQPHETIGTYGGTITTGATGPTWGGGDDWQIRAQFLFALETDLTTVIPNVAKAYEWSDDLTQLTVYLREGMRWSDGHPFTVDDVMFWYEDIMLNESLTPGHPAIMSPGGEFLEIEAIDEYAFRFHFQVPYAAAANLLAVGAIEPYAPKHYLSQFHINYNPDADELAAASGYENWYELLSFHNSWNFGQQQQDVDRPCLYAWKLDTIDAAGTKYFSRNPYYFKVDPEGNQLPYIDNQIRMIVESTEVFTLRAMAGEITAAGQWLVLSDYPLLKDGEERGGYRVMLWDQSLGSTIAYGFNYEHPDPVLREIFNDLRFRQAMSLAIDRQEINDTHFFDLAIPRQATATPDTRFLEPWMEEHYAEYDPERAAELLDDMGLEWDAQGRYRLRPDGTPLALTMAVVAGEYRDSVSELVSAYWQEVGIAVDLRTMDNTLRSERMNANELDVNPWPFAHSSEFGMYTTPARVSPAGVEMPTVRWREWFDSAGALGTEPPPDAKRAYDLLREWQLTLPGTDEYMDIGREFLALSVENLWQIGTVGMSPQPVIVQDDLRNVPTEGTWGFEYRRFLPYGGDQWFFER